MPPDYKPLSVTGGMGGATPSRFAESPVSFDDASKAAMALRAQEIVNQSKELQFAEQQRQVAQQDKLRNTLIDQYSGQEQVEFKPEEALGLAQQIALEGGDLDTALNIEKTKRANRSYQPYSDEQRAILSRELGYELPEGVDSKFVSSLTGIQGKRFYKEAMDNTEKNRLRNIQKNIPGGHEITDPSDPPSEKMATDYKMTLKGVNEAENILSQLEQAMKDYGPDAISGPGPVVQRSLISQLTTLLKGPSFDNMGANFTDPEIRLLMAQMPRLISSPNVSLGQYLVEAGLGRDPFVALEGLKTRIRNARNISSRLNKIRPKQVSSEGGANFALPDANQEPSLVNYGGSPGRKLPRNPDGSPLSREQFYEQFNKGG